MDKDNDNNNSERITLDNFSGWKEAAERLSCSLHECVLRYEAQEHELSASAVREKLWDAYLVMEEAIQEGLSKDMRSRSGMVNNGGKKVMSSEVNVLSDEFKQLVAHALAAKELNACMGRVVAAPTAGASGILPAVLSVLKKNHHLSAEKIVDALLIAAGVGIIIERRASIAGSMGGCQAETGSAAAMASAAITYALKGDAEQVFHAVSITIQCMLGLICDPVAGLVEVPCIVRNASASAIAYSSAQMALAGVHAVIPVDECVDTMGEVGQSLESKYKETAEGGLATSPTGQRIMKKMFPRKK